MCWNVDASLRLMKSIAAALPQELRLKVLGLEDPGGGGSTEVGEDDSNRESLEDGEVKVDLISRAGIGLYEKKEHSPPSWLPNLSRLHDMGFVANVNERTGIAAKIKLETPREHYSENEVLSVYGAVCDRVTRITLLTDEPKHYDQSLSKLGVDYVLNMKEKDHPAGIRPLQALYYTERPRCSVPYVYSACQQMTTEHDWSYVDLEATGGLSAYLESRFRDCGDSADTERWRRALADMSPDDRQVQIIEVMVRWGLRLRQGGVLHRARLYRDWTQVLVGAAYAYGLSETQPRETVQSGGFKLEKFEIHR
ncbi:hypothetical protein DL769_006710 [Monosporascus sp. CRB-8-3]|nr:hypothetical protein DL769_006710 [Monosporascus sp. CRB-8-3]